MRLSIPGHLLIEKHYASSMENAAIFTSHLIDALERRFPSWYGCIASISEIDRGHGKAAKYRLTLSDGSRFFLKVFPGYLPDRKIESMRLLSELAKQGSPVNEAIDYFNDATLRSCVGVSRWIDAPCVADCILLQNESSPSPMICERFGRELRSMHRAFRLPIDASQELIKQAKMDMKALKTYRAVDDALREKVGLAIRYLSSHPRRGVSLLHGDLHPGNMFLAGDRILAVDFEAAQFGDRLLDLANLSVHLGYSLEERSFFHSICRGYNVQEGDSLKGDLERFPHICTIAFVRMHRFRVEMGEPSGWY